MSAVPPRSRPGPPTGQTRRSPRNANQLADVREAALDLFAERGYRATGIRDIAESLGIGPTSVYSHVRAKGELLRDIVLSTLDAVLAAQHDAMTSTDDVVEQLRRIAESQVRYFLRYPRESIITTRDFTLADEADLPGILERRQLYRHRIEHVLTLGEQDGRLAVKNSKLCAFAIIEMCESVPTWYRPDGEVSAEQVAYLYGEYAVRVAGDNR